MGRGKCNRRRRGRAQQALRQQQQQTWSPGRSIDQSRRTGRKTVHITVEFVHRHTYTKASDQQELQQHPPPSYEETVNNPIISTTVGPSDQTATRRTIGAMHPGAMPLPAFRRAAVNPVAISTPSSSSLYRGAWSYVPPAPANHPFAFQ